MRQILQVEGMTCNSCVASVKKILGNLDGVKEVEVSLAENNAIIISENKIDLDELKKVLPQKYKVKLDYEHKQDEAIAIEKPSWIITYKPILVIFAYITLVSVLVGAKSNSNAFMAGMNTFMACFFLLFSFFKLLDLAGFVNTYAMYDVIAKKWKSWGYIYAFIELGLGLSFILNCCPIITNWITIIIMSISLIGVIQSVLNKETIKCACLGTVFNLPMSTITIIEDALMIIMSLIMLICIH